MAFQWLLWLIGPRNPSGETTIAQRMGFIFIPERLIYSTERLITRPDQWKGQGRSFPSADSSSSESSSLHHPRPNSDHRGAPGFTKNWGERGGIITQAQKQAQRASFKVSEQLKKKGLAGITLLWSHRVFNLWSPATSDTLAVNTPPAQLRIFTIFKPQRVSPLKLAFSSARLGFQGSVSPQLHITSAGGSLSFVCHHQAATSEPQGFEKTSRRGWRKEKHSSTRPLSPLNTCSNATY